LFLSDLLGLLADGIVADLDQQIFSDLALGSLKSNIHASNAQQFAHHRADCSRM
jgi:hypothetical protein